MTPGYEPSGGSTIAISFHRCWFQIFFHVHSDPCGDDWK